MVVPQKNWQKWPKMALNGWDKWDKPPGRSYPTYIHPYKARKKINFALPVITLWTGLDWTDLSKLTLSEDSSVPPLPA